MVAPSDNAPRRTKVKMRRHCSTCGKVYPEPRKWAYCSKRCEQAREGWDDRPKIHNPHAYLELANQLETARPGERDQILAEMRLHESGNAPRSQTSTMSHRELVVEARERAEYWVSSLLVPWARFVEASRQGLAAAILLGRRLIEAKAWLPHGEFGRLFRGHPEQVEGAVPFSQNWANRLMRIASHAIANCAHEHNLPADLHTVYALTRLADDEFEAAVRAGVVHRNLSRDEALALLPTAEPLPDDQVVDRFVTGVRRAFARMASEHPEIAIAAAERLIAELRKQREAQS